MKMKTVEDRGLTTWPCLLPKKKIRCYRRKDPGTGTPQILEYCPPDRISFLPDSVQTLILSSLPTKEAFGTSVLSKNWRYLCYSLPSLRFEFGKTKSQIKSQVSKVVHQVLRNYNAPIIDSLSISLNAPAPHNHIDEWVSFAVSHHVQNFILWNTSTSKDLYTLPSSIFSCARLKVARLKNMHVVFPTDKVFLPSLEFLELYCCSFTDAVFSTSNYPMLRKLVIFKCQYDMLSISSSALNFLKMSESVGNPIINLLSIPNLSYIGYLEDYAPNISFETLASLPHAFFVILYIDSGIWDLMGKLVKGLRSVRVLEVGTFYVECLRLNWGLLEYPVAPCFSSVKSLKLVYSGKQHVPVLKVLLRSFPNLEFLEMSCVVIATGDDNTDPYWDEKEKERLPTNFLNSLVTYEARVLGKNEECKFEMMKFIVENATALRNINILPEVGEDINEEDVLQKLNTFSQKSASQLNVVISRRS